jgi:hypothetical protein
LLWVPAKKKNTMTSLPLPSSDNDGPLSCIINLWIYNYISVVISIYK